jgi:hypothetical protein
MSSIDNKRLVFWTNFLEKSKTLTDLTDDISPTSGFYFRISTSRPDVSYDCSILQRERRARLELYIHGNAPIQNKAIFDELCIDQDAIEREFGDQLLWRRELKGENKSSIVEFSIDGIGGLDEQEKWPRLQDQMIHDLIRFDKVFHLRLTKLHR